MLPPTIPIFPLPNVVLFPNVFLPLHIFEPRYRKMVDDALNGDRIIGMVLLRPGWESRTPRGGRPCTRLAAPASSPTPNGSPTGASTSSCAAWRSSASSANRMNGSYRIASVEPVPEPGSDAAARTKCAASGGASKLLLVPQPDGTGDPKVPSSMPDEDLVNALAQYLEFEAVEKQALLERDGVLDRCRSLIELLEMKVLVARHKWSGDDVH